MNINISGAIVLQYLKEYHLFEQFLEDLFRKEFQTFTTDNKQRVLYFSGVYFGLERIVQYESFTTKCETTEYNERLINNLNLNQILNICGSKNMMYFLNGGFSSLQTPSKKLNYYEACLKIVRMRNIIAHETATIRFNDKSIIEVLSANTLDNYRNSTSNEWLILYLPNHENFENFSNDDVVIMSNLVYLDVIYNTLKDTVEKTKLERISDDYLIVIDDNNDTKTHFINNWDNHSIIDKLDCLKNMDVFVGLEDYNLIINHKQDKYIMPIAEISKHADICKKYFNDLRDKRKIKEYIENNYM